MRSHAALLLLSLWLFAIASSASAARFAYIANYGDDTVSVIDLAANAVVSTIPVAPGPSVVAVNAAGTRVYVGHSDPLFLGNGGSLSVIDTATNTVVANIFGLGTVGQIIVEPSDAFVYVLASVFTFAQYFVTLVDASSNTVVSTISGTGFPGRMAINPTGPRVYLVAGDGSVQVLDGLTNTVVTTIYFGGSNLTAVAIFDPVASRLYVPDGAFTSLYAFDTVSNALITAVAVGQVPRDVVVDPSGTHVYVMNWGSDSVSVVDAASLSVIGTIPLTGVSPTSLTMNPSNHFLYALIRNVGPSTLAVIDTTTNSVVANVSTDAGAIAAHPDGTRIYTSETLQNSMVVRDASSGAVIKTVHVGALPMGLDIGPEIAVPLPTVIPIPTLSSWALAVLATSLSAAILIASGFSRRRS